MKYFVLILVFFCHPVFAQNEDTSSLIHLEKYTSQFGIQFAYNPDKIKNLHLENVSNREELRTLFNNANVAILEVTDNRWLLKSEEEYSTQKKRLMKGRVIDSEGEALVSALIYSDSGQSSSLTDESGTFILELSEELGQVCCQYLGYEVQCLDSSDPLNFELAPLAILMDDVKIETKKVQCRMDPLEDAEVVQLSTNSSLQSTLGKDVMRSIQLLSGLDATNDLSASMNIRATSGLQSLVTLDGIPLYNTETAFGMFSVLNPLVVTEATLYKNSMPLEYGEFTGGYLACEGLGNLQDKLKLNIDINTLQSQAAIQIPIAKSTQISGAFRRSNGRISNSQYYSKLRLQRKNLTQNAQDFARPERVSTSLENRFGDAYINLSHEWKKNQSFSFSFFGNRDQSGTMYDDEYPWKVNGNKVVRIEESYEQEKIKANLGLSMRYLRDFRSKSQLLIMFYSSVYGLEDKITSNVIFTGRNEVRNFDFDSEIRNTVRDNNLKIQLVTNKEKVWSWKVGLDLRRLNTDFGFRSINERPYRQNLRVPIITPYLGLRFNHKKIFIADIGFRNAIIPIKNPVNFASPRGKILLKLREGLYLKTSASYNQQFFRPIELERQLGQSTSANIISTNRDIPILRSAQITGGMNYFYEGFKLNGDLFLRANEGILEQVLSNPGFGAINIFSNNDYELFEGVNKVAGLDLSMGYERKFFTGMLSYTLSKSEDQFEKLFNNEPLPDQNNRTHQVNAFGAYEVGPWTFSSTYVYGSGVYTLNRLGLSDNSERVNLAPADLFTQLPAYNRWDLSASYKLGLKKGDLHFDVGIYNLLNNNNINSEIYIYSLEESGKNVVGASQVSLLGRIWTLGMRYAL